MTCDGGDILEGTAPASVALTVSGTPAGTAVLTDAALTVGTQDYHWTFTPSDTANYNTKTGIISLTVRELPPGGSDGDQRRHHQDRIYPRRCPGQEHGYRHRRV